MFEHYMILNNLYITDWEAIRRRTKELIKKRTEIKQEFKLHNYRVFEKLLINDKRVNK